MCVLSFGLQRWVGLYKKLQKNEVSVNLSKAEWRFLYEIYTG